MDKTGSSKPKTDGRFTCNDDLPQQRVIMSKKKKHPQSFPGRVCPDCGFSWVFEVGMSGKDNRVNLASL